MSELCIVYHIVKRHMSRIKANMKAESLNMWYINMLCGSKIRFR